jgi:Sec-independent protein secretion pathway component TatC
LLAIPLIFLYGVSIGVAWVFGKKNLTSPTSAPAAAAKR